MTPMIDVVFLLIIFFMLVGELKRMAEEAVVLPFAAHAQEDKGGGTDLVVVNITKAKGVARTVKFVITKNEYNKKALEDYLAQRAAEVPDTSSAMELSRLKVKIRADSYVEFKYVQRVLLACMKANIWQVSFGVAPDPSRKKGNR